MNGAPGEDVEAAARRSYGRLVAFVAARSRDVRAAEDALGEAFASALETWPRSGVPRNPEAWLLTVARRSAGAGARRARRAMAPDLALIFGEARARAEDRDMEFPDERLNCFSCVPIRRSTGRSTRR